MSLPAISSLRFAVALILSSVALGLPAAQRTWDGGGLDHDWRTAQNWNGTIRLDPIEAGDTLIFPEGPTKLVNTNDFGAGTNFNSLIFSGDDYIVRGSRIGLTNGISVTHASGATALHLPITLRDDQSFTVSSASAFLHLYADISIGFNTLTFDGAGTSVLIGEITNPRTGLRSSVVKTGPGRLTIFQPTEHDVPTVVNGGTLAVESRMTNSTVTVNAGGTLRGSGRIGGLNVNGGLIHPGGTTPDALECYGDATLAGGSILRLRLNGTTAGVSYDQLEVKGTVTLGGTLEILPGFMPAVGNRFTLIDNDGTDDVVGTFAGLPEGAEFTLNGRPFRISYGERFGGFGRDVNDVTIEAIPALAIWDAGGGLNKFWSQPLNWVGDVLPMPGDDVQFANTGSGTLTAINDLPAGSVFGSIIFDGGIIRLEGANMAVFNGSIQVPQRSDVAVLMPMTLKGGMRLTQPGRLLLGGPLALSANQTFWTTHTNSLFYLPSGVGFASPFLSITGAVNLASHDLIIRTEPSFAFGNPMYSVRLSGDVIGSGSIVKQGGGWLDNYSATFAVPFTVQEGTVTDGDFAATAPVLVNTNTVFRTSFGTLHDLEVRGASFVPYGYVSLNGNARFLHGAIFDTDIHYVNTSQTEGFPSSSYVIVNDQMELSGCTLNLRVASMPERIAPGRSFTIIDVRYNATLTGTFNGLPEGSRFIVGNYVFTITYAGGFDGRSVAVIADAPFVWDGGASGNLATTAANWVGDFAPIADTALVFPAGVTKLGVLQDFPANTRFRSLTFNGPSYVFAGNSFRLSEGLHNDVASGDTTIIADVATAATGSTFSNRVGNASRLILEGGVSGNDTWRKSGAGTLRFTGALPNNLSGVEVREGELELDKPAGVNAISRSLSIGDGTNDVRVTLLNDHQIDDSAGVTIRNRARLDLNGNNEEINSLQGDGTVSLTARLRAGRLTVNGGGSFGGVIAGDGGLTKAGTSQLTLSGQNTFSGTTIINGGTLHVSGSLSSPTRLDGGVLSGGGSVGTITGNLGGTVAPGVSTPTFQNTLQSGNITLNASTQFRPLLLSVDPDFENSKLVVSGTVSLGGALLALGHAFNFTPPLNKIFVILENDGADPIAGTFAGLPEGTVFGARGFAFRISYVGGSGNDITVTRVPTPASTLSAIEALGSGRFEIQGAGLSHLEYIVQAASNLNPVISWVQVGRATGDSSGVFQFIHSNAPSMDKRFYRAVSP